MFLLVRAVLESCTFGYPSFTVIFNRPAGYLANRLCTSAVENLATLNIFITDLLHRCTHILHLRFGDMQVLLPCLFLLDLRRFDQPGYSIFRIYCKSFCRTVAHMPQREGWVVLDNITAQVVYSCNMFSGGVFFLLI